MLSKKDWQPYRRTVSSHAVATASTVQSSVITFGLFVRRQSIWSGPRLREGKAFIHGRSDLAS